MLSFLALLSLIAPSIVMGAVVEPVGVLTAARYPFGPGQNCFKNADCKNNLICHNPKRSYGGVCASRDFEKTCKVDKECPLGMECITTQETRSKLVRQCGFKKCDISQACPGSTVCFNGNCQKPACKNTRNCLVDMNLPGMRSYACIRKACEKTKL